MTRKDEVQKFSQSASEGIVEGVSFRGDATELRIRVNNTVLIAKRGLEEQNISIGDKVDVFIYRMFVTKGDKVELLVNEALKEDPLVI